MNSEQITSLLRTVLQIGGTLAVTFGYVDAETSATLQGAILALVGAVTVIGATAWGLYARSRTQLVASAAALPDVAVIQASPSLASAVPSGKVRPVTDDELRDAERMSRG